MQTFLPDPDFSVSASLLDSKRLGKQRVEALQVFRAQHVPGYGWRHHPAAAMWRGFDEALVAYGVAICDAWVALGHADTVRSTLVAELGRAPRSQAELDRLGLLPPWLGDEAFHRSHRSALVRKDPQRYRAMFPDVPDDLPYVWPSSAGTDRRADPAG
jgi:hypothetical protein